MATEHAPGLDRDDPPRDSKRIKLIQSEVDAAATKEAQDYYITRLNDNYKKQLEAMEEDHEEQIQTLKSQLATSDEKMRMEDQASEKKVTEAAEGYKKQLEAMEQRHGEQRHEIQELKSQLAVIAEKKKVYDRVSERKAADASRSAMSRRDQQFALEGQLAESRKSCSAAQDRALKAEREARGLRGSMLDRLNEQALRLVKTKRQHATELAEAKESSCVEIAFTKRFLNGTAAAPKFALTRRSATFSELAKLAIDRHDIRPEIPVQEADDPCGRLRQNVERGQ
jgi:hypothetical protein